MDKGKRAEDSEVVVIVRSRHLKVKIKELFNLERNGASTREKGSGHEANARHLTITRRSGSGRKSRDSDSADMLPLQQVQRLCVVASVVDLVRDVT